MQERREFTGVTPVLDESVCPEHGLEPLTGIAGLLAHFCEMLEVATDVAEAHAPLEGFRG